jgi:hypothetical protein
MLVPRPLGKRIQGVKMAKEDEKAQTSSTYKGQEQSAGGQKKNEGLQAYKERRLREIEKEMGWNRKGK